MAYDILFTVYPAIKKRHQDNEKVYFMIDWLAKAFAWCDMNEKSCLLSRESANWRRACVSEEVDLLSLFDNPILQRSKFFI